MFTYNGTPGPGNHPVLSITRPGVTTDQFGNAVVGNAVATYNSHGAAINIMDMGRGAFFQYRDLGSATQGILILSIASVAGTDTFGNGYPVGQFGQDPFGNAIQVIGSSINLFNALIGASTGGRIAIAAAPNPPGNTNPYIKIDAPEQAGAAGHMQMLLQGTSPDGTQPGQCLIGQANGAGGLLAPTSQSMLEVQSNISGASPVAQFCTIAAVDPYLGCRLLTDANNRLRIDGSAPANRISLKFGPGGGTTQDSRFYNSAAQQFAIDRLVANIAGNTPEVDNPLGTIGFGNLTLNVATYRMLPDGTVFISVKATASGAITANTFNFTNTLPAAYRPGTTTDLPVVLPGAQTNRLTIATSGVVSLTLPALVLGNRVTVQGAYDLQ